MTSWPGTILRVSWETGAAGDIPKSDMAADLGLKVARFLPRRRLGELTL